MRCLAFGLCGGGSGRGGKSELHARLAEKLAEGLDLLAAKDLDNAVREQRKEQARSHLQDVAEALGGVVREGEQPPQLEDQAVELAAELLSRDVPSKLVPSLRLLDFEARKNAMNIFCLLLRPDLPKDFGQETVKYITDSAGLLEDLIQGCEDPEAEVGILCGTMLRSCARRSALDQALLERGAAQALTALAGSSTASFDVTSDAFSTLRSLLLGVPQAAAPWLAANSEDFFAGYSALLESKDYVTQRQSLKLLNDLLLSPHFTRSMVNFVSNGSNLKPIMNFLLDESPLIQIEAFHIFKLFVANPNMPKMVALILTKNREGLLSLVNGLGAAHEGTNAQKKEDSPKERAFKNDQKAVVKKLQELRSPSKNPPLGAPASKALSDAHTVSTATGSPRSIGV